MIAPEQIILSLCVAALLGCAVGLERGRVQRAAGLRTHAMVAVGSALFMLVSIFGFGDVAGLPNVDLDPSRVAAQVVSGIGFLGAGAIILRRDMVRGLTTAASVWAVAAVGLAVGGGMFLAAFCATGLVLLILAPMKPLEQRILAADPTRTVRLILGERPGAASFEAVQTIVEAKGLDVERLQFRRAGKSRNGVIEVTLSPCNSRKILAVVEALREIAGVTAVEAPLVRTVKTGRRAKKQQVPGVDPEPVGVE